MREPSLYVVLESFEFTLNATVVIGDFWAWEEIKGALDFALSRDPYAFPAITGTDLRAVQLSTMPPHAVYFTVDESKRIVTLEAIF